MYISRVATSALESKVAASRYTMVGQKKGIDLVLAKRTAHRSRMDRKKWTQMTNIFVVQQRSEICR